LPNQADIQTIRKVNLATFMSSVFGSRDVGFYLLNEYFLDTFVGDGNRLLQPHARLLLELKTQCFIQAMINGGRSTEDLLEDLFPSDLEERLLSRRLGAKQLHPNEIDFVQRAKNRRKALLDDSTTEAAVENLPEKYVWEDFLRDIQGYVNKNFQDIVGLPVSLYPLI